MALLIYEQGRHTPIMTLKALKNRLPLLQNIRTAGTGLFNIQPNPAVMIGNFDVRLATQNRGYLK